MQTPLSYGTVRGSPPSSHKDDYLGWRVASTMSSSHPYSEPSLVVVLVISGFLLCLNFINSILDIALHCGLIGQIFIGVLFGTPGVKVLGDAFETNIISLGYLGLILLVYQGEKLAISVLHVY
jgi:hypothetical protein